MERREICTAFLWRNMKKRDSFEDVGVDGRIILNET
jgi:hypothetical protein